MKKLIPIAFFILGLGVFSHWSHAAPDGDESVIPEIANVAQESGGNLDIIAGKAVLTSGSVATIVSNTSSTNTKLDTVNANLVIVQGKQDTGNTSLSSVVVNTSSTITSVNTVDTDLLLFKIANHSDLTQIDLDILAFKLANHVDLNKIDVDLLAFALANHTDLTQIDTDLLAFKSANHLDISSSNTKLDTVNSNLVIIEGKQDTGNASLSSVVTNTSSTITSVNQVDTDLLAFKSANHSDLTSVITNTSSSANTGSSSANSLSSVVISTSSSATTGSSTATNTSSTVTNTSSTNTKLDTVNTNLVTIQGKQDTGNASLSSVVINTSSSANTGSSSANSLSSVVISTSSSATTGSSTATNTSSTVTNTSSTNTKLDTVNTNLVTIQGKQDTGNTSLASIVTNTSSSATNTSSTVTNQTNGAQKSQRVDGSGNVSPAGDIVSRPVFVKPGDGTNSITVKAASSSAITSDTSLVTAFSPNTSLPAGSNVVGALVANQSINLNQFGSSSVVLGQQLATLSMPVVTQGDLSPATQNVTAQDTSSTTTAQANGQNAVTGTPTANSAASFTLSSFDEIEVQVTGTWTGTLVSEVSMDGGTTWFTRGVKQSGSAYITSSFTQNFEGDLNLSAKTNFRVRATAAMTGTATVKIIASINPASIIVSNPQLLRDATTQSVTNTIKAASSSATTSDTALVIAISPNSNTVQGTVASGSTDSGNPVKTGGIVNLSGSLFTDGQRANTQMDTAGSEYVNNSGRLPSYSAVSSFVAQSAATDIFTITGSATKTVKVRTVTVSGTNTGNTNALIFMLKRSTANSAGTSTSLTRVPHDSNNAAATATALSYTANPTTGTLVGNIYTRLMFLPSLSSSNVRSEFEMNYGQDGAQPIVLRGTSEVFAVNLNAVAITGTTNMNIRVDWTEE